MLLTLDDADDAPAVMVDDLVATADEAMYRAKRNGGNQCHHQVADELSGWRPAVP